MSTEVDTLLHLKTLLSSAIDTVVAEKTASPSSPPSLLQHTARQTAISAAGALLALLHEPGEWVMEVAAQYLESRALHAVSLAKIPEIIHDAGGELDIETIADRAGYDADKCARIMRQLVASQIFKKTSQDPERFANNAISQSMVRNTPLEDYVDMYANEWYAGSNNILKCMRDNSTDIGTSPLARDTIFNDGQSTWWQYNDRHPARHDVFANAMDYPWSRHQHIVDVGGGIGKLSLAIRDKFPHTRITIQDRESVIEQARVVWSEKNTEGVDFQVHDFFAPNPAVGKDAYALRHIAHDWDDASCIKIFSELKKALAPTSRVLILEALLGETGYSERYIHMKNLNMMNLINGKERTADEVKRIVNAAGLQVVKIWTCRGSMSVMECALESA
ncbi:S-adenosyl-L-methionine-dependent methyltransferase [Hymenopellis radicata]|nr:S-adenosyl-L-methionine-dependent methyltransferase [Hymenopellis radicata]